MPHVRAVAGLLIVAGLAQAQSADEIVKRYGSNGLAHSERVRLRAQLAELGDDGVAAVKRALASERLSTGRGLELVEVLTQAWSPASEAVARQFLGYSLIGREDVVGAQRLCQAIAQGGSAGADHAKRRVWQILGDEGQAAITRGAEGELPLDEVVRWLRHVQRSRDLLRDPRVSKSRLSRASQVLVERLAEGQAKPEENTLQGGRGAPDELHRDSRTLAMRYCVNRSLLEQLYAPSIKEHTPLVDTLIRSRLMGKMLVALADLAGRTNDPVAHDLVLSSDHVQEHYRRRALGRLGSQAAMETLIQDLLSPNHGRSLQALSSFLSYSDRPESLRALEWTMVVQLPNLDTIAATSPYTAEHFHQAVLTLPEDIQRAQVLSRTLLSKVAPVRQAALRALAQAPSLLGQADVQDAVEIVLADLREAAADAVGDDDEEPAAAESTQAVLLILEALQGAQAPVYGVPFAMGYLDSGQTRIRDAAVHSLEAQTDARLPGNASAWKAWWQKHRADWESR